MKDDKRKRIFEEGKAAAEQGLRARTEGRMEDAEVAYQRALSKFEAAGQVQGAVLSLNNLATVALTQGAPERASTLILDALGRAEDIDDTGLMAMCGGNLGAFHLDAGDFMRAEIFIGRALELYAELGDDSGRGNQLANLALIARSKGETDRSRELFTDAIGAFMAGGNMVGAGRSMLTLGETARLAGDRQQALESFKQAGDLLSKAGDHQGLANVVRGLGHIAFRGGDLGEAKALFERGLALHLQMKDIKGQSAAALDLANVSAHLGQLEEALELYERAAELAVRAGVREALAGAKLASVAVLKSLGRLDAAEATVEEARTLFEAIEHEQGKTSALITRASLRLLRGRLSDARQDQQTALELAERNHSRPLVGPALGIGAGLDELEGNIPARRQRLAQISAVYQEISAPAGHHNAQLALVELDAFVLASDGLDEALADSRLSDAAEFFRASGDVDGLDLIRRLEGAIHRCYGSYETGFNLARRRADQLEAGSRVLDAASARHSAEELRLLAGLPPDLPKLEALVAFTAELGSPMLEIRARLLLAEVLVEEDDLEGSETECAAAQALIAELPNGFIAGSTVLADVRSRLATAAGEAERADLLRETAVAGYRKLHDEVSIRELDAWRARRD